MSEKLHFNFWTRVKKVSPNIYQNHRNTYWGNISHFFLSIIFKFLPKKALKPHCGQIPVFWAKNEKIFKTKKLIKKVRKLSLDTLYVVRKLFVDACCRWLFRKFLMIFFLPLFYNFWAIKSISGIFSRNTYRGNISHFFLSIIFKFWPKKATKTHFGQNSNFLGQEWENFQN